MKDLWQSVLESASKRPNSVNILSSIIAALGGVLLGLILMIIVSPTNAFGAFFEMMTGPLSSTRRIGQVVRATVPILLTGLSVAFAFRTGLFNIGASGQMMFGGVIAIYIGVHWDFLGPLHWVVGVLGGMLAGAFWGLIPGLLKAFRNVHEVVASIMLNYIALYVSRMIIYATMEDATRGSSLQVLPSARIPAGFLPNLFGGASVDLGIVIAILAAVIIHIILNKTTFGFELKSVGLSRPAAKYAGIKEKRSIVLSMAIAGALAGLAGALYFLVGDRRFQLSSGIIEHGFTGIAIALLALSAPLGVIVAAFFYGVIYRGGWLIQTVYREELIDIIIGFIIYFSALSLFTKQLIASYLKRRTERNIEVAEKEGDVT